MKIKLPNEHLRRISDEIPENVDSLRIIPHCIYYALSSIPMLWQSLKYVDVLYHIDGSISIIKDKFKMSVKEFKEKWIYICTCDSGIKLEYQIYNDIKCKSVDNQKINEIYHNEDNKIDNFDEETLVGSS